MGRCQPTYRLDNRVRDKLATSVVSMLTLFPFVNLLLIKYRSGVNYMYITEDQKKIYRQCIFLNENALDNLHQAGTEIFGIVDDAIDKIFADGKSYSGITPEKLKSDILKGRFKLSQLINYGTGLGGSALIVATSAIPPLIPVAVIARILHIYVLVTKESVSGLKEKMVLNDLKETFELCKTREKRAANAAEKQHYQSLMDMLKIEIEKLNRTIEEKRNTNLF